MDVLREQAAPLLENLWRDSTGWSEIRCIRSQGEAKRPLFMPVPLKPFNTDVAFEWARRENAAKNNAYMGVHPRVTPRGRNEDVAYYAALIADLDNAEKSWPAVLKLQGAGAPPSACVRTARGVHLYWFLKKPEVVDEASRQRMAQLQVSLHSDNVHDPARILRLPGTFCWKGEVPHQIYLAWLRGDLRYTTQEVAEAVAGAFPGLQVPVQDPSPPLLPAPCAAPGRIPDQLWACYSADWPRGTRSEQCLSFIQTAVLCGWGDPDIRATLASIPIGQHYADRGFAAESSLDYDLHRARQNVATRRGSFRKLLVARAGLVIQEDGAKLRVWLRPEDQSFTFCEWLSIPQAGAPQRIKTRWDAFAAAIGLSHPPSEWAHCQALEGRALLAELKENEGGRTRAVWFGAVQ